VFLVNSRHPLVCATGPWLPKGRSPLSRSYGGKLPSSFNTVLSRAWVCSTSPPVSVWGTVRCWGCFLDPLDCQDNPLSLDNVRRPSPPAGRGMLTSFPSATAFALALGAGSPCADEPCAGTLGLPATGTLTLLIATHVSMCASDTSSRPHDRPSPAYGTLRYRARCQMSDVRCQKASVMVRPLDATRAASARLPDSRRASAARSVDRRNRDPGRSAATPASRRPNRSPSSGTA
jgi:hypothetical protein